jgi:drug/metabolite transporter (DMT)-like permease
LRVARPSVVATYAYVNPLVAVFLGAAIGGETLTAYVGLATVMVVGAVALIALRRNSIEPESVETIAAVGQENGEAGPEPIKPRLAECES